MTLRSGTGAMRGLAFGLAVTHAFLSLAQTTDRQFGLCSGGSSLPPPQLQLGVESSRAGTWPQAQVSPFEYQCMPRSPQVLVYMGTILAQACYYSRTIPRLNVTLGVAPPGNELAGGYHRHVRNGESC